MSGTTFARVFFLWMSACTALDVKGLYRREAYYPRVGWPYAGPRPVWSARAET